MTPRATWAFAIAGSSCRAARRISTSSTWARSRSFCRTPSVTSPAAAGGRCRTRAAAGPPVSPAMSSPLGVLFVGSLFLHFAQDALPADERRRLTVILYGGLLLRLAMATCLQLFPQFRLMHDDANGYEANSMAIALSWKGLIPEMAISWD